MVAQATQEQEYDKWKEKNNDSSTLHNAQELKHQIHNIHYWKLDSLDNISVANGVAISSTTVT